ncbi:BTB POZ domain containing protein [Musa troglodytarum]|uniref:BTB POZ domain containing protein n=1 Tax=Musa troglodytarum TaxID=320322 RepID=A0A9E7K2X3_9LILI|nr:BTB POZ domain containing protein [Musa troglodytarum]
MPCGVPVQRRFAGVEHREALYSMLIAADKYDIPFLRKSCEHRILAALRPSNALEVLQVAEVCSDVELKEQAMSLIAKHADDVVFSAGYDELARNNAHLCVEITRALLTEMKHNREATTSPDETST